MFTGNAGKGLAFRNYVLNLFSFKPRLKKTEDFLACNTVNLNLWAF